MEDRLHRTQVAERWFSLVSSLTERQVPCSFGESPWPAGDPAELGLMYQREMPSKEVAVCTVGGFVGRESNEIAWLGWQTLISMMVGATGLRVVRKVTGIVPGKEERNSRIQKA